MVLQKLFRPLCCLLLMPLVSCDTPLRYEAAPHAAALELEVPVNLPAIAAYPARNPLTEEGVALGRMLFYDPVLSKNGTVSCASCHQQDKAFSDGLALSKAGVSGEQLKRHVPSLVNLAWMNGMFWDGGAKDVESLNFGPLTHPDEMGQDLKAVAQKLQNDAHYPQLFKQAFGTDSITSAYITRALAQFERTLISGNSRYDRYVRGEANSRLNSMELEGLVLFQEHCSSCHATDLFTDNGYHNNGLDAVFPDAHEGLALGRGRVTAQQADIGKYKTPTLRNIAFTAPYMHDGRFETLEQVLEHYGSGIQVSPSLAPQLQANGKAGIPVSTAEKEKLIAFLHTLSDGSFVNDKRFSNPF